jgi:hypothetical protein
MEQQTNNSILIKATGIIESIIPKNNTDWKLAELQKHVCGLIDIVSIPNTEFIAVVNDEGLINGSLFNSVASIMVGHPLFGDVVICLDNMVK